jgi:hypothetical protein
MVDPPRQIALAGGAIGMAAPHLWGQIMGMGMKIALSPSIGGAAFHGIKPGRQARVFFP